MKLQVARGTTRRAGFTLMEVLVVVAILVILASVAIIAVPRYIDDARKSQAQLRAQSLGQACESYNMNQANDSGYPQALNALLQPPFGGPSFLKNGDKDLVDPWNKPYNYEIVTRADQTQTPLISTTAPDGTLISNFGIGDKARPNF